MSTDATSASTRCKNCRRTLAFDEWSRGFERCPYCRGSASTASASASARRAADDEYARYERMLDELPEELVDELVAALEAEVEARQSSPATGPGPVREVLEEIGLGRSPAELQWAAWAFAGGFAGNLLLAKYAQMSSGSPVSDFVGPFVLGGLVAGGACAAIGWGLAKLRVG